MSQKVSDLGEFPLIAAVTRRLPQGAGVLLGPGDDAAVVAAPDGRVVAATDMLIENRHFRRDWSSAYDVGRKAAAQNLSDIAAMGAVPTVLMLALGTPPDLPVDWVTGLADGLRDEGAPLGVSVVGGDTVRSDVVVVSVTALGDLGGRAPVTRSGARPGDVVAVCGRLGWAEAGVRALYGGVDAPAALLDAHRRPQVPYDAGPEAADHGATAMCDVSDGLLADVGHIAESSGVSVDIDPAAVPIGEPLRDLANRMGADPLAWVLTGGDDNALVATFPGGTVLPGRWRVVGRVDEGSEVTVGGKPYALPGGHDHFG